MDIDETCLRLPVLNILCYSNFMVEYIYKMVSLNIFRGKTYHPSIAIFNHFHFFAFVSTRFHPNKLYKIYTKFKINTQISTKFILANAELE